MGEKERAEALLQAAGVTGVAVQSAEETVTMTRAEADALRAGAQGETPGQAYVRQQEEQTQAAQLPEGIMSQAEVEEYERKGDRRHAGMSHAQQMEAVGRFVESAQYHIRSGQGR